ncbi:heme peroxidase family protein,putative calcium-binding protein [Xenococcus sp. PCC 7305]|uniref:peroxidase family protein n=1 Tax=Xenococcus sp. PCC 7305 TaxID=102125 RepID=UPI0002ABF994|nr:peroxidase family protein [Xenococcus sp. PCC 7305]ELS05317.1 heme peroxidase family protein,putative calcium-binding protein [Xenococcus sp. PCC 7305]
MYEIFEINFDEGSLAAGTVITDQFTGINISTSSEFGVMLFDTDNVTGEDFDLAATGIGNVLIISEDGDASDPDDKATGGLLTIEFDGPVEVTGLGFLDIEEEGGFIDFFDQNYQLIETIEIDNAGNNRLQELNLNATDVARLDINLAGSGALTELDFLISDDTPINSDFRTITGEYNNLENPQLGSAETDLIRLFDSFYEDDFNAPRITSSSGNVLPNPRTISNTVVAQTELIPNYLNASDWIWQWGQLIDHDLTLNEGSLSSPPEDFISIPVPQDDPNDPFVQDGLTELPFIRSARAEGTGSDPSNPRQQTNELTHFIDASAVYGSTPEVAAALRDPTGGGRLLTQTQLLNTGTEELLPFQSETGVFAADPVGLEPNETFTAGDSRVNEQLGLTGVHTLLVREHNRLAEEIATRLTAGDSYLVTKFQESGLSEDDFIYESARQVVAAQIQIITYNEFLPLLVGSGFEPVNHVLGEGFGVAPFSGYQPEVDVSISNEFANAAYRLGHTLLSPEIQRVEQNGLDGTFTGDAFFDTNQIYDAETGTGLGVNSIFSGLGLQAAQEYDNQIVDGVRNFLFNELRGGFDLAAVNIARGREVGLPTLNEARQALGLAPHHSFEQISSTPGVAERLASVYESVDDVDLWVGGISEDAVNGGLLGATFNLIVSDQFQRARDGDRFFYLNDLDHLQILAPGIEHTSLSGIIRNNTPEDFIIQDDAFRLPFENQVQGTDSGELLSGSEQADLIEGLAGDDQLLGNSGADILFGGDGQDYIQGAHDDDILYGGTGDDQLAGDAGDDQLLGGDGNDILNGGNGHDSLFGQAGHDTLNGGEGADILHGAAGADLLVGGSGADSFFFGGEGLAFDELALDTIEDFQVTEDRILLSAASFTGLDGEISLTIVDDLTPCDFGGADLEADLLYDSATGILAYNANGAESGLGFGGNFVQLDSGLALASAHFEIV